MNRCESQKPFWPAADEGERRTARAIVEHFLSAAIKAGSLIQSTVGELFPATDGTRTGETVVILSPAEKAYRDQLDEDDQEFVTAPGKKSWEIEPEDSVPEKSRPLKPWEDGYVAPPRAEEEDDDEDEDEDEDEDDDDWDEEDIQPPAPAVKVPAREPWEDEDTPPAPAVKKPTVEVEGFRSPRPAVILEGFGRKGGDA